MKLLMRVPTIPQVRTKMTSVLIVSNCLRKLDKNICLGTCIGISYFLFPNLYIFDAESRSPPGHLRSTVLHTRRYNSEHLSRSRSIRPIKGCPFQ